MPVRNRSCPICFGDLFPEEEGWQCLQCGRPELVIPNLGGMRNGEKCRFYIKHRKYILGDLAILGTAKMRLRWQMHRSGWDGIKRRWRNQGIEIVNPGWMRHTKILVA